MLLLFVHLRSQQKRTESHLELSNVYTVLPFWHCYFESSNHR